MISSEENIKNVQKNKIQNIKNNENINENESQSLFFQDNSNNNKNENIPKNKIINNIKKHPLKSIENTISNNINIINNTSSNTALKQTKTFLENNIYKTITKQPNKNCFNIYNYSKEEKYSLLKMKKIKSNKFSPYKSTNHLYNKVENTFDEEKNDSKFLYFKLKKNKKIYSLRKAYISHISFKNENNISKEFKLFRDCDIGLNDGNKIKKQFEDFDVESDEEVINIGVNKCLQNMKTAINLLKIRSTEYVNKYMKRFENF